MTESLEEWDKKLRKTLTAVERPARQRAGSLLVAIPPREEWDRFLDAVEEEWWWWRNSLERHSYCLLVLYGGLAFYEYDDNKLWPQFARAVGVESLPANQQTEINEAFASVARSLGLKIQRHNGTTYCVSSAVYQIGIPLSLWDGFIEVCEWALKQDGWETLPDAKWCEVMERIAGSRSRLAAFLRDNREAASELIREMHHARQRFADDPGLTIKDLPQASLLRREYIEDVPETAEFLCPHNPEKILDDPLLLDHARLVWDDARERIALDLPGVARDRHPATWRLGALTEVASTSPSRWVIDGASFDTELRLKLQSGSEIKKQRLRGVRPWALFDLEKGASVNPDRQQLPLRPYVLISPEKIEKVKREGFDEEENPVNQMWELADRTACFVTRLHPIGKGATLTLTSGATTKKLQFRASTKIEARVFIGEGGVAACFSRHDNLLKVERLPLACVAIPFGYFRNADQILRSRFQVMLDNMHASGKWEKRHADGHHEFYVWRFRADRPVTKGLRSGTYTDFSQLGSLKEDLEPVDLKGKRILSIVAPELGIKFDYELEILNPSDMGKRWQNFPGAYVLWLLLAQADGGMKWEDLLLAKDMIAPDSPLSYKHLNSQLRRYNQYGLIRQQGQVWKIAESRAVIERSSGGECMLKYCGDPSVLWGLYRHVYESPAKNHSLERRVWKVGEVGCVPAVEVIAKKSELPYVSVCTKQEYQAKLRHYLENRKVRIVSNLWSC